MKLRPLFTRVIPIVSVIAVGAFVRPAQAQIRAVEDRPSARRPHRSPSVSLTAGPSQYRLSGNGTGFAAGFRFDVPSGRKLVVEPGFGYFRYTSNTGSRLSFILPEVSFQYQFRAGGFRPFVGIGGGLAEFVKGPGASRGTVHVVGGFRSTVAGRFGFRAEARLRSYDPLGSAGRMFDLGFGGTWLLGN